MLFRSMLYGLVPKQVAQRFQDELYNVVCELAKIAKGADGQLSTWSRKRCVEEIDPAFWGLYLRHGFEFPSSIPLYLVFYSLQFKAYRPSRLLSTILRGPKFPIPSPSLPIFIRLIQTNPTSAAFSLLTMYSIRHRTLADYPDSFENLFRGLSDSDKLSHGIGKLTIPSPPPLQLI